MSFKSFIVSHFKSPRHKNRYTDEAIKDTLNEIIWYFVFLITVNIVTFSTRSVLMYYFSNTVDRLFIKRTFFTTAETEITFEDIVTIDDWWHFLQDPFINGVYSHVENKEESVENEENSQENEGTDHLVFLSESIFMGPPRIRQLKVRENTCSIHSAFKRYFRTCYARYSWFIDDREKDYNESGYFTWGKLGFYRGGGHAVDFTLEKEANEIVLKSLKNSRWIELGTRLIVVEFNLYNANTNLFCLVKFFAELPPIGGVVTSFDIRSFEMLTVDSTGQLLLIIVKVLFYIQLIFYAVREGFSIYEMKFKYFKYFWNWVSMSIIGMGIFLLLFEIVRSVVMWKVIKEYNAAPHRYVDMDAISFWQYHAINAMALLTFLVWIEMFKYVSFNKTMLQFSTTLRKSAQDLFGFGVMFAIVFIAFAQLGYLLFGTMNKDFKTMTDSVFTMMRTILGDFEYLAIEEANRILGPIFFLTYIFFVLFVLLNMFLAIINGTYTEVKSQITDDDIQIWSYIKRHFAKFCKCICCGREIYKYNEVEKTDSLLTVASTKTNSNSEKSDETRPPTAAQQTTSEPPIFLQDKIVVKRKDLLGKLFKEIGPEEQPTSSRGTIDSHVPSQPQPQDVEERLQNLETIMDTFLIRMNNLISKLDAEENGRSY